MVKISIKKEEKTIKPKQKQKQSQKVVVNIGNDVFKPKRKRAPRQALQKGKVVNRQQTTPTQINVPQALPINNQPQQQSMNELIKYLKESETQKEIIKEKDKKINELEKDKKDKERSKILTEDEVQNDFSNVYNNSNISSLTNSGTATPRLSFPVDSNSLITALRRESDLRSENPNSGVVSLSTPSNNLFSLSSNRSNSDRTFTTRATNNTQQSSLSYFLNQPVVGREDLTSYIPQAPPKDPTETKMQSNYEEKIQDEIEAQQVVPVDEAPVIDEVINEEPDNQLTVYEEPEKQIIINEPQRTSTTATSTQQLIGMDNTSIPAFLRPINTPLPAIRLNDIIGQRPTAAETKDIRQARIDKLDKKKPVLALESQSSQAEAEDTIKLLENILKPKPASEPASEPDLSHLDETPELRAFKDKIKAMKNKEMGQLLRENNIKGSNGENFTVNKRGASLGTSTQTKESLKNYLLKAFNDGLIN